MDNLDPVDLEEKQRLRLLTAFHNILTYDDREKVIRFCEQTLAAGPQLFKSKDRSVGRLPTLTLRARLL